MGICLIGPIEKALILFALFNFKSSGMSKEELLQAEEEQLRTAIALSASMLPRSSSAQPPPSMLHAPAAGVGRSLTPPLSNKTPEVVSRTRSAAFKKRKETDKSNKKLRKSLTKVAKALSNPKDLKMKL